ncbi:MAG: nucleoside kinase [Clostridia bacterium]|nr:nucleoside kinase [Clostridia bacterium]
MINLGNSYRRYALTVDKINEYASQDPVLFVKETEDAYRRDIRTIAADIVNNPQRCRVIMLAGPSASGKTTTAKILSEELGLLGCPAEIISMDDFYRGEANVPRTPQGKPDFECVEALNIPQIEKCINELLETGECEIPIFNFAKSEPSGKYKKIDSKNDKIAIIEGIHALNSIFTDNLTTTIGIKKIYISVKQGIHKEGVKGYFVTASELRLMRRIVRDNKFRSASANHTIGMWDNVLYGEKKYIKPFKYSSDITINSIHIYEPCITASAAINVLGQVTPDHEKYEYAQGLIERCRQFVPIDESLVPKNSLLREFIGKGKYKY